MKGVPFLPKLVYRRVVKRSKVKPLNKKLQVVEHPHACLTMIGFLSHPLWFVHLKVTTLVSRFGILRVVVVHNKFV